MRTIVTLALALMVSSVAEARCPQLNKITSHRMISAWMEAEVWGHTRPHLAKNSCLNKKPKHRLWLKTGGPEVSDQVDLTVDKYTVTKVKRLNAFGGKGKEYTANILLAGKDSSGKPKQILKEMTFLFPHPAEANIFGCVRMVSEWNMNFIGKECKK